MTESRPAAGLRPDLRFRIINWIGIIDQLAATQANRVLRAHDLQLPQFVMLNHFSHRPDEEKTVTGIARAMQQPQPGVTKTVQKLVARGWLQERPAAGDGRSKVLKLTPRGRARHATAVAALLPFLEPAFADWSDEDLARLFAMLDRLKVYLDTHR